MTDKERYALRRATDPEWWERRKARAIEARRERKKGNRVRRAVLPNVLPGIALSRLMAGR
jgi:hypothetical protein